MAKYIPEPFRIKMVENIKMLTREERCDKIREASYNLFRLKGEDVYIDTLTDSGTNAMSSEMWSGLLRGDEAYAGAKSYYRFIQACQDVFGYGFFCPVHQGRAAEKVLFPNLLHPGTYALANLFFDTTRGHVVLSGARALECVCEEAKHPELVAPFKGNMDTALMEQTILEKGPENVGLVVMTLTNNSAGGQPVSMANLREVSRICQKYGIPLCIDAARYAENAMFIKQREAGYADKSIPEIVRECFSYADMFTMSAKKDTLVNMGGVIGIKDPDSPLIPGIKANCISFEGFYTYGGLNGRDLECLAVGLYEGMDESYLTYRLGSIAYLGGRLDELGIPYQKPAGSHACSFPLTNLYGMPHGEACAFTLDYFIRFNAAHADGDGRITALARDCGFDSPAAMADAVHDMKNRMGMRTNLCELGVESDAEIHALAHQSMSMLMTLNPVPLTEEDIYKMFCALK